MNKLKKGQKLSAGMTVKTDGYFEKRKEVMEIIYQLRELVELPRIEVKIADSTYAAGLGQTGKANYIVIEGNLKGLELFHVVLHEVVHTAFKYSGHNEKCLLMSSTYNKNNLATKEQYLETFMKYAK